MSTCLASAQPSFPCLVIKWFHWVDTRDMFADGITKGSLDRQALQDVMRGVWVLKHAMESHCEHT